MGALTAGVKLRPVLALPRLKPVRAGERPIGRKSARKRSSGNTPPTNPSRKRAGPRSAPPRATTSGTIPRHGGRGIRRLRALRLLRGVRRHRGAATLRRAGAASGHARGRRARRPVGPRRHDPAAAGHHLQRLRPSGRHGADLAARPGAAHHPGQRVGPSGARSRPAGTHPGHVPRRPVRGRTDRTPRRRHPYVAGRIVARLCARGHRHQGPRSPLRGLGHRPGARHRGHVPGPGGQPAGPVRRGVRAGEPGRDDPRPEHRLRAVPGAARQPLRRVAAADAVRAGADRRQRSDGRGAHAGCVQLRLLRARVPGPPDGRGAGRGPGPGGRGRPGPDAHDPRASRRSTSSTGG